MEAILVDMRQDDITDVETFFKENTRCPVCRIAGRDHCQHLLMEHCDAADTKFYDKEYKKLYKALEKAEENNLIESALDTFILIAEQHPAMTVIRIVDETGCGCGGCGECISYYIFMP